ncbi:MAG: L-seryl-tRNA(Sec) selenium transferase [Chloroflexi bacterium GWB2_49_20]|nr:MAG: L-seryl-tRNA(Sec) selenium transferase [Chloroflexi bacterium GWB2_49_20]OGN76698.1 MAG: L-seryl-tRNA(Sec) selenium transferase [Chloroflexi bacterium GWC2_49_37]OGN83658.1 MAG: L-seryl-tRNA(Sec) selenium transferase [Chloroflexi bacterium GWD2_49_16]HBG74220.1 L-seryl-tRNA(Sec) selenium transferase [Anaerolineae bacterium]HCC78963.1 L-seryl-tRNA(Sec) selenium transferase [Anaerolineae bacterium]
MTELRSLPSVEKLLQTKQVAQLITKYGRPLILHAIRETLGGIRINYAPQAEKTIPERTTILEQVKHKAESYTQPTLLPVINATGVVLHTNLGRAPLSQAAIQAMETVACGYSNLEFDLSSGKRGSRLIHAEKMLQLLLGTEAALIVNNNASAVLLAISALARRKRVIISRTQLVEIGGGFRVPDVMKQSGAKLVEIGTTNRVHLADYELALQEPTALVMRVHRSNFKLIGFTSEPDLQEIAQVAHLAGLPLLDDLGSGALLMTERFGLAHEPTVQESLTAGADLVCFSGDKLVGGPQAGIIVGKADLIQKIKKHPLARAVRADKICLAALSATLLHYLKDEAENEIPIWRMISTPLGQIKARARNWASEIGNGEVITGLSTIGGGSLPGESLPTWLLALDVGNADKFLAKLRAVNPPIIARTENDRILLDPRTVLPENEGAFLVGLQCALRKK